MKFLLTKELGRLSKWLRILGFDTAYFKQDNASSLIIQALRENRTIITRNSRLPKPTGIRIVPISSEKINQQVPEVVGLLKLKLDSSRMFTRCIICNQELAPIDKRQVKDKVPEYVFNTQEEFVACGQCKRIYWRGSHWGNVQSLLKEIS